LIALNSLYALVYSVAVLSAAILIFQRRDLK
jgi:ABC-type transport system involved in multi-copper enzyme maturation permease subunit